MKIWKYVLETDVNRLEMPKGARVLCVHEQHGRVFLWALVDETAEVEEREFEIFGTGQEGVCGEYIGTAYTRGFVWHVFEQ